MDITRNNMEYEWDFGSLKTVARELGRYKLD
jgi:hypothetical protein